MSSAVATDLTASSSGGSDFNLPVGAQMFVINQNCGIYGENVLFLESSQFISVEDNFTLDPTQLSNGTESIKQEPAEVTEGTEPIIKKRKIDSDHDELQKIFAAFQQSFLSKLKSVEDRVESFSSKYNRLEEKVENVYLKVKELDSIVKSRTPKKFSSSVVKGININVPNSTSTSSELKLLSSDVNESCHKGFVSYSEGSWLGDPNNPDLRVRCTLTQTELERINQTCLTPEKMSLTLLDYLFDRETQALSNTSGTGKHGKAQLDPIKMHGIKCHLIYRFGITEKGWQHMKQNIDSKCRSAFRRKQIGLPLHPRSGEKEPSTCELTILNSDSNMSFSSSFTESNSQHGISIHSESIEQENALNQIIPLKIDSDGCSLTFTDTFENSIIHTEHGDIQVIEATEEQLEQLKQNNEIEILAGAEILTDKNNLLKQHVFQH